MYEHYEKALKRVAGLLKEKYSGRIESMYAFGSRVRGDHHEGSDFDILIVVNNKTPDLEKEIIGLIVDLELSMNVSFSPVIKDSASFSRERELNSPFYQNIKGEGVRK